MTRHWEFLEMPREVSMGQRLKNDWTVSIKSSTQAGNDTSNVSSDSDAFQDRHKSRYLSIVRSPGIPGKLCREGSVKPVTFTEEFSALEHKSLNQIIATKIHKELSELRSHVDTSPTIPKRWVWELIQNAKDASIGGKVQRAYRGGPGRPGRTRYLQSQWGRVHRRRTSGF